MHAASLHEAYTDIKMYIDTNIGINIDIDIDIYIHIDIDIDIDIFNILS